MVILFYDAWISIDSSIKIIRWDTLYTISQNKSKIHMLGLSYFDEDGVLWNNMTRKFEVKWYESKYSGFMGKTIKP